MISVTTLVLLVWVHTFADFALQTDKMAINKSKSNKWLVYHVLSYSACLLPFAFALGIVGGVYFVLVNFLLHFATDFVTSRVTSVLWAAGKRHWFFVVIGIDQALHMTALVTTYAWIASW